MAYGKKSKVKKMKAVKPKKKVVKKK